MSTGKTFLQTVIDGKTPTVSTPSTRQKVTAVKITKVCFFCKKKDNLFEVNKNIVWAADWSAYRVDKKLPTRCYLCSDCLEKEKTDPYHGCQCSVCKLRYHSYKDLETALGCDSMINADTISSHWESGYDGDVYTFTNGRPSNLIIGSNICDKCIRKLIDDKVCKYSHYQY